MSGGGREKAGRLVAAGLREAKLEASMVTWASLLCSRAAPDAVPTVRDLLPGVLSVTLCAFNNRGAGSSAAGMDMAGNRRSAGAVESPLLSLVLSSGSSLRLLRSSS